MSDNSFPKENRLRGESDFDRVYERGRLIKGERFVFHVLEGEGSEPRIGIVTPKYLGKAVERNRIKRIIRENFRKNKDAFDSVDLIARPRKGASELSNEELAKTFLSEYPSQ